MTDTIYIPTPVSQKPEKDGWYYVMNANGEIFPSMLRTVNGEFENYNTLRVFYWLRPTTLPEELAAKEKEIADRSIAFARWLNERYTWVEGNLWDCDNDETITTEQAHDIFLTNPSNNIK